MHQTDRFAYRFDGFCIDPGRRILWDRRHNRVSLKPKTFDTLLYLVRHAGELLERQRLLDAIWPGVIVQENSLEQAVSALRRALGETRNDHRFIVTEPGRGYRFVARVEAISVKADSPFSVAAPKRIGSLGQYWLLAATICATLVGLFLLNVGERPSDQRELRLTPWSLQSGGQRSAVWSPDGSAIAFVARNTMDEPFELYVRAIDSELAAPIALSLTNPFVKQWTTDGNLVLLDGRSLWSVPPAGGEPQLILSVDAARDDLPDEVLNNVPDEALDVTRDGSTIAAFGLANDGNLAVWTATLPEANFERYEPAPFETDVIVNRPFLRFSPDGSRLLVLRNGGDGEEMWLLPYPPNASEPPYRVLEDLPVGATPQVSWLPDNRHIVVSTAPAMRRELYIADVETGEFRQLLTGESDRVLPVVSPNGDRLVYTDSRNDFDIVTLDLQSGTTTSLIATRQAELMPAWADDTDTLAYVTDRTGTLEIWLRGPDGVERPLVTARDFPRETQWLMAPALSPDGERVIYQRVEGPATNASGLWMSSVGGGSPVRVTNDELGLETAGSWSPDGSWYVYRTIEPDRSIAIKKVRTNGQAAPETLLGNIQPGHPSVVPLWSPDGDWILVADQGMKLVPTNGGNPRSLGIENAPCAFAETGQLLYCIRAPSPNGEHPFVALNFEGEVVRVIGNISSEDFPATPLNPSLRLSLTPDGSGVTYAVRSSSQDLWLMDGIAQFASR